MGKYRKGFEALGKALRKRAEDDQLAWEEATTMAEIPKRYEETAKRIVGVVLYNEDRVEQVSDLVATAAREAQIRVLEAYAKEARALDGDLLFTLRSRIERGEDL